MELRRATWQISGSTPGAARALDMQIGHPYTEVDRYGVSWQIVPEALVHMLCAEDGEAAGRAQAAMMEMRKLDIAALEAAFHGA